MPVWMVSSSFWLLVMVAWASCSLASSAFSTSIIFFSADLKLVRGKGGRWRPPGQGQCHAPGARVLRCGHLEPICCASTAGLQSTPGPHGSGSAEPGATHGAVGEENGRGRQYLTELGTWWNFSIASSTSSFFIKAFSCARLSSQSSICSCRFSSVFL